MKISYCPKCHMAGLRYDNDVESLDYYEVQELGLKWCPRCKEWVAFETRVKEVPYFNRGGKTKCSTKGS